nr:hypothetical protein Iba_chr11cCG2490 [Ipomoea batatas]
MYDVSQCLSPWPPEGGFPVTSSRIMWCARMSNVRIESPWTILLHSWNILPFGHNLQLTSMQFRFIQLESQLNGSFFKKFHISKTLRLAKFITQDSHSIHSTTVLEMLLNFFHSAFIINLPGLKKLVNLRHPRPLAFCSRETWQKLHCQ